MANKDTDYTSLNPDSEATPTPSPQSCGDAELDFERIVRANFLAVAHTGKPPEDCIKSIVKHHKAYASNEIRDTLTAIHERLAKSDLPQEEYQKISKILLEYKEDK